MTLSINITNPASGVMTTIQYNAEASGIPDLAAAGRQHGIALGEIPVELVGLLGRDVLRHAVVVYDGLRGRFEVTFDLQAMQGARPKETDST